MLGSRWLGRGEGDPVSEHWFPIFGPCIQNVHLKEFSTTADWPALMEAYGHAGKLSHVSSSGI